MSTIVLGRLRDLFVTTDTTPTRRVADPAIPTTLDRRVADRAVPATLGVLASPRAARPAGAALALAVASGRRASCAVVCHWTGADPADPPRPGPAAGAARKLALRLSARGLAVAACGRLVTVTLPGAATEARAEIERALAATGEIPLVLVLSGPRPPALDPLLSTLDRLVVIPPSDAPPGLEPLALTTTAHLGRSVSLLRAPATTTGRLLTTTGLQLSPAWRTAATTALGGDDD